MQYVKQAEIYVEFVNWLLHHSQTWSYYIMIYILQMPWLDVISDLGMSLEPQIQSSACVSYCLFLEVELGCWSTKVSSCILSFESNSGMRIRWSESAVSLHSAECSLTPYPRASSQVIHLFNAGPRGIDVSRGNNCHTRASWLSVKYLKLCLFS